MQVPIYYLVFGNIYNWPGLMHSHYQELCRSVDNDGFIAQIRILDPSKYFCSYEIVYLSQILGAGIMQAPGGSHCICLSLSFRRSSLLRLHAWCKTTRLRSHCMCIMHWYCSKVKQHTLCTMRKLFSIISVRTLIVLFFYSPTWCGREKCT